MATTEVVLSESNSLKEYWRLGGRLNEQADQGKRQGVGEAADPEGRQRSH